MGRKLPNTPRSKIRGAVKQLWMRSRERAAALKATGYCCTECGVKQSKAKGREVKVQVHHDPPIAAKIEKVIDLIADLLASPQFPLCVPHHSEKHPKEKK